MAGGVFEEMLFSPAVKELEEIKNLSEVTEKVLEKWKNNPPLEYPDLMKVIVDNVSGVEIRDEKKYKDAAGELGWTEEKLKNQLQKHVEQLVSESEVFRMASLRVLNGLLNVDGRFLTQFEMGESRGTLDNKMRAFVEARMFGFNMDGRSPLDLKEEDVTNEMLANSVDKRPVYAYLSNDRDGVVLQHDTDLVGNLEFYGDVAIKLNKKRIQDRATVSFKDSLTSKMHVVPSPLTAPHFTSIGIPEGSLDGRPLIEKVTNVGTTSRPAWGELYAEVQLHGQITWEDVESVHLSSKETGKIYVVQEIIDRFNRSHPERKIKLIIY
jgi:hypothetical protein